MWTHRLAGLRALQQLPQADDPAADAGPERSARRALGARPASDPREAVHTAASARRARAGGLVGAKGRLRRHPDGRGSCAARARRSMRGVDGDGGRNV